MLNDSLKAYADKYPTLSEEEVLGCNYKAYTNSSINKTDFDKCMDYACAVAVIAKAVSEAYPEIDDYNRHMNATRAHRNGLKGEEAVKEVKRLFDAK